MSVALDHLLGVPDVCRMAGIKRHSLYRMIRLGKFPRGARFGRDQKWLPDQVDAAIRKLSRDANRHNKG